MSLLSFEQAHRPKSAKANRNLMTQKYTLYPWHGAIGLLNRWNSIQDSIFGSDDNPRARLGVQNVWKPSSFKRNIHAH
jgi:hypothetical protein